MKQIYHPKAFLSRKRNVRLGLAARTRLLMTLEQQPCDIKTIVSSSGLKYHVVVHHLRLLGAERVVVKKSVKRPYVWELTGVGQQRLINLKE